MVTVMSEKAKASVKESGKSTLAPLRGKSSFAPRGFAAQAKAPPAPGAEQRPADLLDAYLEKEAGVELTAGAGAAEIHEVLQRRAVGEGGPARLGIHVEGRDREQPPQEGWHLVPEREMKRPGQAASRPSAFAAAVIQRVKHVKRSTGKIEEVDDNHKLGWGEKFVDPPSVSTSETTAKKEQQAKEPSISKAKETEPKVLPIGKEEDESQSVKTKKKEEPSWEEAWLAKQSHVIKVMKPFVVQFQKLDPKCDLRIRGSLASGFKGSKKIDNKGRRLLFDPKNFDIDAYLVSDFLFSEAIKTEAGKDAATLGVVKGSVLKSVNTIIKGLRKALAKVPGNRDDADAQWRFNVLIRTTKKAEATAHWDWKDLAGLIGEHDAYYYPGYLPVE